MSPIIYFYIHIHKFQKYTIVEVSDDLDAIGKRKFEYPLNIALPAVQYRES